MSEATDVRCPGCSRLLAKRTDDGHFVIRYRDRYSVVIKVGEVCCIKCQHTITIGDTRAASSGVWGSRAR